MSLKEAIDWCHVRSAVYRTSDPTKKYWKNHPIPLLDRIPKEDQDAMDWEEYDPREEDDCSLAAFND